MNLESPRRNKVWVAVGVLVVLAVVGGAYLAFADDEPVKISNAEELEQIRDDLDGHYVLVDDIDMSHVDNFEPIGNPNEPFTGTFDGNGHTISGLTIERPESYAVGMFSVILDEGTVENVTLKDVNVTGDVYVGGLVGENSGTVTSSYVTGNVSGHIYVGGLAGLNGFAAISGGVSASDPTGEVHGSHADAEIKGGIRVGGLIGKNQLSGEPSTVSKSYATGDIHGERLVGGLAGENDGTVEESYATGRVTGEYPSEGVTGEDTGGLIGDGNGSVTNSYWDLNSTEQETSAGGTGLTTDEMTGSAARENMDGFDFGETWRTTEDDYPILAWQTADETGSDTQT